MTTRASHKRRGAKFETDLMKVLRTNGFDVDRLAKVGRFDEGDLVVRNFPLEGHHVILELKAPGADGKTNLTGWKDEARIEAARYAKARGLDPEKVLGYVVVKAFRKGVEDAHWVSSISREFGIK